PRVRLAGCDQVLRPALIGILPGGIRGKYQDISIRRNGRGRLGKVGVDLRAQFLRVLELSLGKAGIKDVQVASGIIAVRGEVHVAVSAQARLDAVALFFVDWRG